jgi:hypothetical protein
MTKEEFKSLRVGDILKYNGKFNKCQDVRTSLSYYSIYRVEKLTLPGETVGGLLAIVSDKYYTILLDNYFFTDNNAFAVIYSMLDKVKREEEKPVGKPL